MFLKRDDIWYVLGMAFYWQSIINQIFPPSVFSSQHAGITLRADYSTFVLALLALAGLLGYLWQRRAAVFSRPQLMRIAFASVALFFCSTASFAWLSIGSVAYSLFYWINAIAYAFLLFSLTAGWAHVSDGFCIEKLIRLSSVSMLCSVVVALAIALVLEWLDLQNMRFQALFPVASGAILLLAIKEAEDCNRVRTAAASSWGELISNPWFLACCILSLYLLCSSVYWSVSTEGMGASFVAAMNRYAHKAILLAVVFLFAIVAIRKPNKIAKGAMPFVAFFAICIAALYCIAIFWDSVSAICNAIVLPTRAFSIFLLWLLVGFLGRSISCKGSLLVDCLFLPVVSATWFVAYVTWGIWEVLSTVIAAETFMLAFTLCVSFVMMIVTFRYIGALKQETLQGKADGIEQVNDRADAFSKMKEAYGLTERETDVLRLLVEGNTKKKMAELMNVSVSSVQSYSKGLYLKLGVHSKQEVIDLFRAVSS